MTLTLTPQPHMRDDSDAPISHFSNCLTGILAQLARLGDLPVLLGPATQARKIASESLAFFNEALLNHHTEQEWDLFPAVSKSAQDGAERLKVGGLVEQLASGQHLRSFIGLMHRVAQMPHRKNKTFGFN